MSALHLHLRGPVAELRQDNLTKLNALTLDMLAQLDQHCTLIDRNPAGRIADAGGLASRGGAGAGVGACGLCIGFTTLYYRNYYASFPTELVRAVMIGGAGFFRIFWQIMLPVSGPITAVSVI